MRLRPFPTALLAATLLLAALPGAAATFVCAGPGDDLCVDATASAVDGASASVCLVRPASTCVGGGASPADQDTGATACVTSPSLVCVGATAAPADQGEGASVCLTATAPTCVSASVACEPATTSCVVRVGDDETAVGVTSTTTSENGCDTRAVGTTLAPSQASFVTCGTAVCTPVGTSGYCVQGAPSLEGDAVCRDEGIYYWTPDGASHWSHAEHCTRVESPSSGVVCRVDSYTYDAVWSPSSTYACVHADSTVPCYTNGYEWYAWEHVCAGIAVEDAQCAAGPGDAVYLVFSVRTVLQVEQDQRVRLACVQA